MKYLVMIFILACSLNAHAEWLQVGPADFHSVENKSRIEDGYFSILYRPTTELNSKYNNFFVAPIRLPRDSHVQSLYCHGATKSSKSMTVQLVRTSHKAGEEHVQRDAVISASLPGNAGSTTFFSFNAFGNPIKQWETLYPPPSNNPVIVYYNYYLGVSFETALNDPDDTCLKDKCIFYGCSIGYINELLSEGILIYDPNWILESSSGE